MCVFGRSSFPFDFPVCRLQCAMCAMHRVSAHKIRFFFFVLEKIKINENSKLGLLIANKWNATAMKEKKRFKKKKKENERYLFK